MRILLLTAFWLVLIVMLAPPSRIDASEAMHAEYVGGTTADLHDKTGGSLIISPGEHLEFRWTKSAVRVDYSKINLLEYGQKVDRRYAMALLVSPMFLLSKSRQHFLTIGYTDQENRQQAMVLRVGKGEIRSVLASLEARTGLKIQYQDTEARKAGRG
jgi:hypothetical protein